MLHSTGGNFFHLVTPPEYNGIFIDFLDPLINPLDEL
jgi:hypothetical protein